MAHAAHFLTLRYFRIDEFRQPAMMDPGFLTWLDEVRHRAGVPFRITSDGRTHIPPGGSNQSLHLVGRAVDLPWPWQSIPGSRDDGRALAAICRAVYTVPVPADSGGVELGLEKTAPGGPHLHIGLLPMGRSDWTFVR